MSINKRIPLLILVLLILLMLNFNSVFIAKGTTEPIYTVKIRMPKYKILMSKHRILGPLRMRVNYIIIGSGEFDYGTVIVTSDVKNIHINSYIFKQGILTIKGPEIIDIIDNKNMSDSLVDSWAMVTNYYELGYYETHNIIGSFIIDTKNLKAGIYTINVVFSLKNKAEKFIYQDSIEYEIIAIFDLLENPTTIITSLIAIILGTISIIRTRTFEPGERQEEPFIV